MAQQQGMLVGISVLSAFLHACSHVAAFEDNSACIFSSGVGSWRQKALRLTSLPFGRGFHSACGIHAAN
jgi:hypothetical protein